MSDGKATTISANQLTALLVCCTWPTIINYGSSFLAREVGQDMWLSGVLSVLTTLLLMLIVVAVGRSFPGKTVVEYSQGFLWTLPGKLLGLVLTVYFTIAAANTVSMYIHHLTDFLLPETPFVVVTFVHMSIVAYLVWQGPEVIARMGVIAFSLAIVFYVLVFLASLSEIDFSRLLPLFDSGILNVTKASSTADSFIGINPLIITMLLPLLNQQKHALHSSLAGVVIGGFFFVLYFIVELMVMGPQVVALMRIASMDFVRSIQITQYLHRFESFMVGLWYWSMLVQAGILIYCSQQAFSQTVGIHKERSKKILLLFLGITIGILTYYIAYDRVFFLNYREFIWEYMALPVHYGLPIVLVIGMLVRKVVHAVRR